MFYFFSLNFIRHSNARITGLNIPLSIGKSAKFINIPKMFQDIFSPSWYSKLGFLQEVWGSPKGVTFSYSPSFPVVSFHTDSGEVIRILLVKCLNDSRIHLGLYHRRHHLKELGDETLFSITMYSTSIKKSDCLVKINVFNKLVFSFVFQSIRPWNDLFCLSQLCWDYTYYSKTLGVMYCT